MPVKAAVCRAFGQPLVIEEIGIDPPGQGEVMVRLAACAICHSDIAAMDGAWGGSLPAVFGHEAAGIVEQTGPGVTGLAEGDPVIVTLIRSCGGCHYCARGAPVLCETEFTLDGESRLRAGGDEPLRQGLGTGAFAERVVVHASQTATIPEDVPLESACLLACGVITGYGAVVNTARVPAGSSVAVVGTGGVGLNSIQGAALSGAEPVIAVDTSDEKLAAALRFGATHAVNPANSDAGEAVRAATGGRGAEFAFITVGAKSAIQQGMTLLCRGGALVVVGMPASGVMSEYEPAQFAHDSQRILGSKMGSADLRVDVPKLVSLYREGRLRLDELVTGRYPLDQINDAVASARRGDALRNVIVF